MRVDSSYYKLTLFNLASPKIALAAYTAGENMPNWALLPMTNVFCCELRIGPTRCAGTNANVNASEHAQIIAMKDSCIWSDDLH